MSVSEDHFRYPRRHEGLDHNWFRFRAAPTAPKLVWPRGAKLALWITVPVEFFPLNAPSQPFRPVGAIDRAYPDLWTYSNRDYGNRVGIFRIARVLDHFGLRATAAVNADIAHRHPSLLQELIKRRWEIMAHGLNMGRLHHGGLSRADEKAMIAEALTVLNDVAGHAVSGWHSPAQAQSMHTLELLAEVGIHYTVDWLNDDLPYMMTTQHGPLYALPLQYEWSDRNILVQHDLTVDDYIHQVLEAFRRLNEEATTQGGGRMMSLSVTPWILGYPHRIAALSRILETIMAEASVWPATASEIVDHCRQAISS